MFALRDYSLGASGVFSLVGGRLRGVFLRRALESAQSTAQVREANVEDMKVITYSEVSQAFAYT